MILLCLVSANQKGDNKADFYLSSKLWEKRVSIHSRFTRLLSVMLSSMRNELVIVLIITYCGDHTHDA